MGQMVGGRVRVVKISKWLVLLLICIIPMSAQAYQLMTYPLFQAFDSSGNLASGYKLYTYEVGTTTPKETYSDSTYDTPLPNPIIMNSRGEASVDGSTQTKIYMDGKYKLVLKTDEDVVVWTVDNYDGEGSTILDYTTLSEYASLSAAVTAIGATEMTLYIDADDTMSGDVTIPATMEIVGVRGSTITLGDHTLTINGSLSPCEDMFAINGAGNLAINGPMSDVLYQIFTDSSTGQVTFGDAATPHARPEWWGAAGDASTDDQTEITHAIYSIWERGGGIIKISQMYAIDSTLELDLEDPPGSIAAPGSDAAVPTLVFEGTKPSQFERTSTSTAGTATGFKWTNAIANDMIHIDGRATEQWRGKLHFRDIYLDGDSKADDGIYIEGQTNRGCTFENVTIKKCLGYGIKMGDDDTDDDSIFSLRFKNVNIGWCGYGVKIKGNDITFDDSRVEYSIHSGVYFVYRCRNNRWNNGFIQYNDEPQVQMDYAGDVVILDGVYFEGQVSGGPGSYSPGGSYISMPGVINSSIISPKIQNCRFIRADATNSEDIIVDIDADAYGLDFSHNTISSGSPVTIIDASDGSIDDSSTYISNYWAGGAGHSDFDSVGTRNSFDFAISDVTASGGPHDQLITARGVSVQNMMTFHFWRENLADDTAAQTLYVDGNGGNARIELPWDMEILALCCRWDGDGDTGTITIYNDTCNTTLLNTGAIDLSTYTTGKCFTYTPGTHTCNDGQNIHFKATTASLGNDVTDLFVTVYMGLLEDID